MTEKDGTAWRQTIYYPYLHASKYGRGTVLQPILENQQHLTSDHGMIDDIVSVTVYNEEAEELTIFAVNRNLDEDLELNLDIRSFDDYKMKEHIVMTNNDLKAVNTPEKENVYPVYAENEAISDGKANIILKKASWNVIRFNKNK